jgi:hypothetical protein
MKSKWIALATLIIAVVVGLPLASLADPPDPAQATLPPAHLALQPPASQTRPARDSAAALAAGWETVKTEDFEGAFPNDWDLRGDPTWDREWDSDPAHPELARWAGWCAGGGTAGRTPGPFPWGQYASDMNAWMIYGPFSLRGCSNGRVDFRYWLWSESPADWLLWSASKDGVNFHNLGATGGSMAWIDQTFWLDDVPALGHLGGKPRVWISFAFLSNENVQYKGAYLDDIEVMRHRSHSPVNVDVAPENGIVPAGLWYSFTTTWVQWLFGPGPTIAISRSHGTSHSSRRLWAPRRWA